MIARGIVLSRDFSRLVIEATDADVEQFGKGTTVQVSQDAFSAMSRVAGEPRSYVTAQEADHYMSGLHQGFGPPRAARLRCRHGFERYIQLPHAAPPPTYRMAMTCSSLATFGASENQPVTFSAVDFVLRGETYDEHGRRLLEYEER